MDVIPLNQLIEQDQEKFLELMLETMEHLSYSNKSENTQFFQLRYHDGPIYRGIKLNNITYRASNKYDLWLKIYKYFLRNGKSDAIYFEDCAYDVLSDYYQLKTSPTNEDAMLIVIDTLISNFIDGDTLWWEQIEEIIIEV